jgi:hypothetical protein
VIIALSWWPVRLRFWAKLTTGAQSQVLLLARVSNDSVIGAGLFGVDGK